LQAIRQVLRQPVEAEFARALPAFAMNSGGIPFQIG
jgi:hypothetical protein